MVGTMYDIVYNEQTILACVTYDNKSTREDKLVFINGINGINGMYHNILCLTPRTKVSI